jgi:hypothetical protein
LVYELHLPNFDVVPLTLKRISIFADSGRGGAFFLTSLFIELIDPSGRGLLTVMIDFSPTIYQKNGAGRRKKIASAANAGD